jgi:hypothetical protein
VFLADAAGAAFLGAVLTILAILADLAGIGAGATRREEIRGDSEIEEQGDEKTLTEDGGEAREGHGNVLLFGVIEGTCRDKHLAFWSVTQERGTRGGRWLGGRDVSLTVGRLAPRIAPRGAA